MTRMASFPDDMAQTQPIILLSALPGRPGLLRNVGVHSTVTSTGRIAASASDAFFQILQILTMSAPPQTVRLVPTREATLSTDSSPTSATTSLPLSAPLPLPPELTHNSKFGFAFPDAPGTSLPLIPPLDEPTEPETKPESATEGSEAPGSPGDLGATPLPRLARAFSMPVASQLGHLKHPRRPSGFGSPASSSGQPYTPGLSTIYSPPQSAVPQDYVTPKQLPYSGLSLELADTAQLMIQTLLQLSPPHMLDPAREQFSGCTLQLPTTSVGGMLTAMKGLNWMSVRLAGFMEDENTNLDSVVEEHTNEVFDVGELLQSAGDVLGGIAAQAGIHVVIYHADVGLKHVGVQGDEGAASYVLSHVVRQVMAIAEPGETIELGLFVDTQGGKTICSFEITHVMHEPVRVPVFDTVITRKLLTHVRATLQARPTPVPSSPSLTAAPDGPSIPAHNSQSYTLTIPFTASPTPVGIPSLTPAEESERQPFPTLRLATEPSLDELAKFSEAQLRGKRATFYAQQTSSFAIHLMSYLTTWGVGVEHRDIEGSDDPSAAGQTGTVTEAGQISFIIIDDDVSILRKRLVQLRSEQLPVPHPRKRPSLAANHRPRSSPHIRPVTHTPSPVVIHFTSLANYKLVRDVVQSILSGCSVEVLVIPKPAGPRRCLVALYTALARPLVDPVFSPIATSPTSPSANMPRVPGAARWGGVGGVTRPSPLAIDSTSTRGYFSGTADLVPDIATSPNTGVVLQDLEGRPAGILFQPKRGAESPIGKKSAPASPTTPGLAGPRKVSVEGRPTPARTRSGSKGAERDGPVRKPSGGPGKRRGSGTEVKSPGAKPGKKKPKESDIVPPISVLIVEDNPINLGILSMFIKRKKIKCDVARDGQQAVEKWKTGRFHLIFMDIQMPVMDGIEATREIRRLEKAQHGSISTPPIESPGLFSESKQLYTPASDSRMFISGPSSPFRSSVVIVALTASSLQSDRVAALAAGCNDFLTKPVSLDWLDKKIIEWGSIKALQMWADPDMVKRQEAKAKAVAGQLRIDRAARTTKSPSRASLESVGGGPKVTGPEIHVQAPTPPAGDQREMEKPALVRRITKSPSPLSRSMVLPGPPPAVVADGEGGKPGIGNGKPPEPEPPVDEPVVAEPVATGVPAVVPTPEIEPIEPIPSISAYPLAEAESYFPPNATLAQCPVEPAKTPEPVLLSPSQPGPGTLSPETDTPYQSANSLPPSPS